MVNWFVTKVKITRATIIGGSVRLNIKEIQEGVFFHPETHIELPFKFIHASLAEVIKGTNGTILIGKEFQLVGEIDLGAIYDEYRKSRSK